MLLLPLQLFVLTGAHDIKRNGMPLLKETPSPSRESVATRNVQHRMATLQTSQEEMRCAKVKEKYFTKIYTGGSNSEEKVGAAFAFSWKMLKIHKE